MHMCALTFNLPIPPHTCARTRTNTHTHARAHTHTHTQLTSTLLELSSFTDVPEALMLILCEFQKFCAYKTPPPSPHAHTHTPLHAHIAAWTILPVSCFKIFNHLWTYWNNYVTHHLMLCKSLIIALNLYMFCQCFLNDELSLCKLYVNSCVNLIITHNLWTFIKFTIILFLDKAFFLNQSALISHPILLWEGKLPPC